MNIEELNFQLKYFYLINTDCIIEDLQSNNLHKNFKKNSTGLLDVFHLIFSKMIEVTKPYTNFILSSNPASSKSLFGEAPSIPEISVLFFLCETSLFHHCIIQGYKYSLNEHITQTGKRCANAFLDFASSDLNIKFSATTMPAIRKGCLHSFNNSQKHTPKDSSNEHQQSYGQCKRVLHNDKAYSARLIQQFCKESGINSDTQIFVAKTKSTPTAFLFDNGEVKYFNTVLKQKEIQCIPFLQRYKALYTSYSKDRSVLSIADKILFDIVLEQAYGFSLFSYIYELLYNMENTETFKKITALRGDIFYKIISDYLAKLPITYNRSVLLKYACEAISNSPNLFSMYPKEQKAMTYETFTSKPEISFATEALQIMDSFFRLLNYSVLPLLENLWLILTNKLGISFNNYQDFIEKYHSIMTYDYTCIPTAIFFEEKYPATFCDYYNILQTYVQKNKNFTPASMLFSNEDSKQNLGNLYKYDFCNTIKQQCTIINPSLRKDIVHHLLEPLQNCQNNYFYEQQAFINNHAKNIFKFTQTLDWDALSKNNPKT